MTIPNPPQMGRFAWANQWHGCLHLSFAGLVQQTVGLNVVLGIDLFTMALALYGLFIIHIPTVQSEVKPSENFWRITFWLGLHFQECRVAKFDLILFLGQSVRNPDLPSSHP